MDAKLQGESSKTAITELRWMAEFLDSHGQQKKALEIYRALVETLTKRDCKENSSKGGPDKASEQAA